MLLHANSELAKKREKMVCLHTPMLFSALLYSLKEPRSTLAK